MSIQSSNRLSARLGKCGKTDLVLSEAECKTEAEAGTRAALFLLLQ